MVICNKTVYLLKVKLNSQSDTWWWARELVVLAAASWWCFGLYRASPGGGVAEVAVFYHEHKRVLGVVQSGESLHHCWWT
jgi:hypothetical protein